MVQTVPYKVKIFRDERNTSGCIPCFSVTLKWAGVGGGGGLTSYSKLGEAQKHFFSVTLYDFQKMVGLCTTFSLSTESSKAHSHVIDISQSFRKLIDK